MAMQRTIEISSHVLDGKVNQTGNKHLMLADTKTGIQTFEKEADKVNMKISISKPKIMVTANETHRYKLVII